MTDRELLELAAKAAGITGWQSKHGYWNMTDINGDTVVCCNAWSKFNPDTGQLQNPTFSDAVDELNWNPLTDDGDALRLAVKLKLFLDLEHCNAANSKQSAPVWFGGGEDENAGVSHDECDPCAATRRAITRAAAEIGKKL